MRLDDIGELFTWLDLRDFVNHLPPSGDSALYRSRYPQSWWWNPSFDFLSAVLNAVQWGNWQRGGGKGDKPKPVKRPKEMPKDAPMSAADLEARKNSVKAKRRAVN